jgi:Asp-tRNA(Asn)/Glu-tRNA(Gln) amidotransferase A subunit family amidase
MWTLLQVPVVNVPGFSGPNGMPLGLSLVSRRFQDRKVIALARLIAPLFTPRA